MGLILMFSVLFPTIYMVSYHTVFKQWASNIRPEASSCAISFVHGTPAFVLSTFSTLSSSSSSSLASSNTRLENSLLEFSLSYFVTDLVHYLRFYPSDLSFVLHHMATLFVLSTCRYLVFHGASAVLLLLAVAESTSALQNTWTLAKAKKGDDKRAARLYEALSLPFYVAYSVARGVVGPLLLYRIWCFFYAGGGEGLISVWLWGAWIGVVLMAIAGSLMWIITLWAHFLRDTSFKLNPNKHL